MGDVDLIAERMRKELESLDLGGVIIIRDPDEGHGAEGRFLIARIKMTDGDLVHSISGLLVGCSDVDPMRVVGVVQDARTKENAN